jgi:hypothetical protein
MEMLRTVRSLSGFQKILLGIGVAFLLYTVFGVLAAPALLKYFLTKNLTATLHREVRIEKVRVNPFFLSVRINDVTVGQRDRQENFLSFDEIYGNFQILSLFRWGVIVREIRLETPHVRIVRSKDGRYNFSDLIDEFAAKEESPPGSGPPPKRGSRFSLNNIQIQNGRIDFRDGPKEIQHTVRNIRVSVPFLSNFPYHVDRYVQPALEAVVNDASFSLQGQTKPFKDSLETSFDVDLKRIDVPFYLDYAPFKLNFTILSAFLDIKGKLSFIQYRDRDPALEFSGKVSFDTVDVEDDGGRRFLRFPLLDLSIESSELVSKTIRFSQIFLDSPEIQVRRDRSGRMNLQDLLPGREGGKIDEDPEKVEGENESGVVIEADLIRLANGIVSFSDVPGENPFRTTLAPFDLEVSNFRNARGEKSAFRLSLSTESKETAMVSGDFTVSPPAAEGMLELGKVRAKKYSPYYASGVLFDVEDGAIDLSTRFRVARGDRDTDTILSGLSISVRSLRLKKRGKEDDFLVIPALNVRNTNMDLSKKMLVIGDISTGKGAVRVRRPKGEEWNLAGLFSSKESGGEADSPGEEKAGEEDPWRIEFGKIRLDDYAVQLEDRSVSQPVVLNADRIRIRGENLSTERGKKGKASVSFALNGDESVSAEGDVRIDPAFARLKIVGKGLDIVPLQPYFTERMNVIVRSGAVFADGTLSIASPEDGVLEAAYTGEASLKDFASADKEKAEDFLNISSLDLTGLDVGIAPSGTRVDISRVGLTDFFWRIIIFNEGGLNIRRVFKWKDDEEADGRAGEEPTKPPAAPPKVTVAKVILQGGTIHFSDLYIEPDFSANMLGVSGEISGISSEEGRQAEVNLKGNLETQAPLVISGKLNPFPGSFLLDLKMTFDDIDLVSLTPYSGKYAGYRIQKGKLSLDVEYLIVKQELDSRHRVFLDQLTLGDQVDSPEATKLPVKLAIALLKNRKGEIELDLPVTGNVDDPEFSVAGVILKILKNILVKAATSPFALLGAVLGGGEELSYIEFDYGHSVIPPQEEEKLTNLAKVLFERPALKMEIAGHVDPERDREELRTILFQRKLKAQKLKDTVGKGKAEIKVDEVVVTSEEYPKYLKKAYKAEKFPKPRNFLGIAKKIPEAEMEKLMYTHIEVTKDNLRLLALERAKNVRDHLLTSGKVEANRLFLTEPESLPPEKSEKGKNSRVDLRIR